VVAVALCLWRELGKRRSLDMEITGEVRAEV
jgi:hypothetical protein